MQQTKNRPDDISGAEVKRRMQWVYFIAFNGAILLGAALLMPYRHLADGVLKPFTFASGTAACTSTAPPAA